ncbi:MAG: UDP-glucose/GDP-mannose dehydrogenase [Acidobacteriaceae bacterium]|jgi:UDPglucose 6-dehydrogenase|nr:UDP-glucose/GDP-mannose dehydrogenase [Acidobacteriaceae bacterium]
MHVGVYGSGYLATVLSACLADFGVPVVCADEDTTQIHAMSLGTIPYFEKNLQEVVRRNIRAGRLTVTTDLSSFAHKREVIFLAQDSSAYLEEIAVRIARICVDELILVICTPVSVGTAGRIQARLRESARHVTVVSQPLFLTDGCALEDFNWPDRILLGTSSAAAVSMLKQLYRPLVMRGVPVIVTSLATAELVREASTAFVATKISFINELAGLCEHVDADAVDLALALGLDKKVAPRCLQPGAGFGGPFVESDMDSLAQLASSKGVNLKVLTAAREVNLKLCDRVVEKISGVLHSLQGKQLGLLGLSFKPHTNSIASSASIVLAKRLIDQGAKVQAYDPAAMADAKLELNGTVSYCETAYDAAQGVDALVISTAWPEFRSLDFGRIKRTVKHPVIIDPKNVLDPVRLRAMGFEYVGMGRAS